jgi:sugar phosphate isomerase/epimerase
LRLREAVGPVIGANYDPISSGRASIGGFFIWLRHHHVTQDTYMDQRNIAVNGVLDTKPYSKLPQRSWTFRTVGYGHDLFTWRAFVSALRLINYDYVLSIEHEDPLASREEGLNKAVTFLKDVLLQEQPAAMWWA